MVIPFPRICLNWLIFALLPLQNLFATWCFFPASFKAGGSTEVLAQKEHPFWVITMHKMGSRTLRWYPKRSTSSARWSSIVWDGLVFFAECVFFFGDGYTLYPEHVSLASSCQEQCPTRRFIENLIPQPKKLWILLVTTARSYNGKLYHLVKQLTYQKNKPRLNPTFQWIC